MHGLTTEFVVPSRWCSWINKHYIREAYEHRMCTLKLELRMVRTMLSVCGSSNSAPLLATNFSKNLNLGGGAGTNNGRVRPSLCPAKIDVGRGWIIGTPKKRSACLAARTHIGSTPQGAQKPEQQQDAERVAAERTGPGVPGLRDTIWNQLHLALPSNPKLERSISADVVVVGAGITGLSVAYNLAKSGKKVVILEARAIGAGQTGKTCAQVMAWNDDYYHQLEKNFGADRTRLVAESHRCAIDWIEKIVEEEGIACNFKRVPGYLVAIDESEEQADKLRKEFEAAKRAGFTDVKLQNLKNDPKNGDWGMGVVFPGSAEFHPLLYIKGLAKAFKEKYGGQIYENSAVIDNQGTRVTTTDGHNVTTEAVVLATNSPINKNPVPHTRQFAARSYAVALKVPRGTYNRACWWDTQLPYHYVRLEDKDDHEVLIVGGENHVAGLAPTEYYPAYENLEKYAREHWPAVEEVVGKWTGQVLQPSDYLGFYGKNPLDPSPVYIATGDSGQGMTGGTIAGIVISSEILGQSHRWSAIYDPSRLPPATRDVAQQQGEVFMDDLEGFKNLLPLQGVDSFSAETVGRCSGAVVQEGLNKVAVFRDEGGTLHRYSAICPHLGCVVKWNPKDSTFDCPCHGTYFDTQGICINGPAKRNLEPISYN